MMRPSLVAIMLALTSTAAVAQTPPAIGKWERMGGTAALTGARSTGAILESSNILLNMLGNSARASLIVRCDGNGLALFVDWPQVVSFNGQNMMGQTKTMAFWRIDDRKIDGNLWDVSSTGTAAGEFKHKNATKFLAKIVRAKRLVVRLTGRQTQDAEFDLTGIEQVGAEAAGACGVTFK